MRTTYRAARATSVAERYSRGPILFASVLALLPAPVSPRDVQSPPVFATGVEVVAVDVSVVDGDGRPVRGLGPADFTLKVGGRARRIVSVQFGEESGSAEEAIEPAEAPPETPSP